MGNSRSLNIEDLPRYVFFSYSRSDERIVSEISGRLDLPKSGAWLDKDSLVPGTPDWEKAIRAAIRSSYCILLFCSPSSRDSQYVQAELALATHHNKPVLPIWITGQSWIDAAPLALAQAQYVDLRAGMTENNAARLKSSIASLLKSAKPKHATVVDCYAAWYEGRKSSTSSGFYARAIEGYLGVVIDSRPSQNTPPEMQRRERLAIFDPEAYGSVTDLLQDIYVHYVAERAPLLSYGRDWLLHAGQSGVRPARVVAPWNYLNYRRSRPISEYNYGWGNANLREYGLGSNVLGELNWLGPQRSEDMRLYDRDIGIAVNSETLLAEAMSGSGKQPISLKVAGFLQMKRLEEINPAEYSHAFVITNNYGQDGDVYVETQKVFDPKTFRDDFHRAVSRLIEPNG